MPVAPIETPSCRLSELRQTSLTSYLIAHVDVGVLGQQERHQVNAALLRRQVNGADALPRHCVSVGTVLQQRGPDVHLVLFGCNVEGRVAVLRQPKGGTCLRRGQQPL